MGYIFSLARVYLVSMGPWCQNLSWGGLVRGCVLYTVRTTQYLPQSPASFLDNFATVMDLCTKNNFRHQVDVATDQAVKISKTHEHVTELSPKPRNEVSH